MQPWCLNGEIAQSMSVGDLVNCHILAVDGEPKMGGAQCLEVALCVTFLGGMISLDCLLLQSNPEGAF